jgi:O-antigen ligase
MTGTTLFAGVALLTLAAPFELTEPLVRLPRQSISSLEAALLTAFAAWGAAIAMSRQLPQWRTPLTAPWLALIGAMLIASAASTVSRVNAFHMTGRLTAALGVYLLTVNALTTPGRLRAALLLTFAAGVVVAILVVLEYAGVRPVLAWLAAFRPGVATVGAQVRAGGPLQYPTIASMYLEVVFAFGLGLLLAERARGSAGRTMSGVLFAALLLVGQAITLTFTRAGLITTATSLVLVGVVDRVTRRDRGGTRLVAALALGIGILFAVSRPSQSMWLRLTSEGQESWYRAAFDAPQDIAIATGRTATVPVTVTNTGRLLWDSQATPPILLSYHWLPADRDGFVLFEGVRTAFASPVAPDAAATVEVRVRAPQQPGDYRLEWDLVQEGRLWFSTEPGAVRAISHASVRGVPGSGDGDGPLMPPPRATVRPGRLVLWTAAARMFAAHPIVGVGPDNFRLAYGSYAGLAHADPRTHSNNMYLEVLAGGGIVAFAAFAWLLWRAGRCVADVVRAPGIGSPALALGVAAAAVAIALHAAFDSFLSFAPTYVLFALTLGCAAACMRGTEVSPRAHRI